MESWLSIGVAADFTNQGLTPIWARYNRRTAGFPAIRERLRRSSFAANGRYDGGHVWLPLNLPPDVGGERWSRQLALAPDGRPGASSPALAGRAAPDCGHRAPLPPGTAPGRCLGRAAACPCFERLNRRGGVLAAVHPGRRAGRRKSSLAVVRPTSWRTSSLGSWA